MGMVRFLAAATQLELTENRDVKEMTCRRRRDFGCRLA